MVKDGKVIAHGVNQIQSTNDPTAHAELLAIRAASQALGTPQLEGCVVYASGLAAMSLAGIGEVAYAYSNEEGEPYGLSTAALYAESAKPLSQRAMTITHILVRPEGEEDLYDLWRAAAR